MLLCNTSTGRTYALNAGPTADQRSGEKSSVEMNEICLTLTATSAGHTRRSQHVSVHHHDHFRSTVKTSIIRQR